MTHGGADTQDLFVEKIRNIDGKVEQFHEGNGFQLVILVKKYVPKMKKILIDVIKTTNGNVIFGNIYDEYVLSLSDPGGDEKGTFMDRLCI